MESKFKKASFHLPSLFKNLSYEGDTADFKRFKRKLEKSSNAFDSVASAHWPSLGLLE